MKKCPLLNGYSIKIIKNYRKINPTFTIIVYMYIIVMTITWAFIGILISALIIHLIDPNNIIFTVTQDLLRSILNTGWETHK